MVENTSMREIRAGVPISNWDERPNLILARDISKSENVLIDVTAISAIYNGNREAAKSLQ